MAADEFAFLDPRFSKCINSTARVHRLFEGCAWAEGPAWSPGWRSLVWSDIPNDRQLRWDESKGSVGVFRHPAGYTNGNARDSFIGLGMWLGIIMMINVWAFIWPNQKRALGIVEADADTKAKAGKTAMLFSRTNLLLSIPMLATMTMNQTMFG